jgi:hypothetical protein
MRIAAIILTLMVFSSSAFAECVTNARGRVVCNNGEQAGDITPRPATLGSQRGTRLESLRRRRAQEGKPRPRMVRAYIRARMAKIVTRQHITTAVIKVVLQNENA